MGVTTLNNYILQPRIMEFTEPLQCCFVDRHLKQESTLFVESENPWFMFIVSYFTITLFYFSRLERGVRLKCEENSWSPLWSIN